MKFFQKYFAIDLGSANTLIYLKGKGIIVNEPSIVAYNNRTNKIVAVGLEAKKMLSRTPMHINAFKPINYGVIADFDMAKKMILQFLKDKNITSFFLSKALVSVPTNLTEVERKSFQDLFKEIGIGKVYVLEKPLAAGLGIGLDLEQPNAYLIVDIGAGTTDIAIVSLNGVVVSNRIKVAGNQFNEDIIRNVKEEFKLNIGEPTAEEIKINIGSVVALSEKLEIVVRGRDLVSGLPREIIIKDNQIRPWFNRSIKQIIESVKNVIELTPPELVGDIYKNGIYLTGGSSLLKGIDQVFEKELGVNVRIVNEPTTCVIRGLGLVIEKFDNYKHLFQDFSVFLPKDE